MGNNVTEAGRKAAELKAQKRAAALRENLKRRKEQAGQIKGKDDAKAKDSQ